MSTTGILQARLLTFPLTIILGPRQLSLKTKRLDSWGNLWKMATYTIHITSTIFIASPPCV